MTENNCEFAQEPRVGSSAGDSNIVKEHPSQDSVAELNHNYSGNSCKLENESNHTIMSEECDSRLSNSGCEHELPSLQDHWLKLSTFFRRVYHSILNGEKPPNEYESHVTIVRELVASDPHQLFARLEMDLQEFIIEVKLRQLELLNCVHTHEGPQLFIFCLIESYNKLMFAASTLSPLLSHLEKEHLAKFDISWRGLNQHLFHKLVFTDPKIQKVIPLCISKLGKMNSKLSDFNKKLIRQFLNFDGEMIRIGAKWREAESSIIKYHQENSMLDAKERMMKVNWELIKTQSKVFHEELKSSGISSDVGSDILSNGHVMNTSNDDCSENIMFGFDDDKKTIEIRSAQFQTTIGAIKTMEFEFDDQEVCESCHLDASRCLGRSVPLNFESSKETKIVTNSDDLNEILDEDLEILTHLNAEGRKMYSHLHKFKAQQVTNGGENVCTVSMEFTVDTSAEPSAKGQDPLQSTTASATTSTDPQETAMRKQMIQQQQKRIMQMIQTTTPQKDIQQKIQKQLQEQQILMQQQRKIEELQNHILQQHPLHMDKEMQKKMHQQMQQCLMQKHKQMEEKFHQQVQQHMQQHQEIPSSPVPATKLTKTVKDSPCCQNFNHKCSTPATTSPNVVSKASSNVVTSTASAVRAPSSKTVTTNVSTTTNVTHKNSTTQTTMTSMDGQNRNHHPLPDVVKSASYVCPKHSEGTKPNAHNHVDADCSENSSDDDFSSERSSSPQRHCDCCYCEVFGSAPVRRNYQETRERLRSILNKKKAKSNAAATDGKVASSDPATSITDSSSRAASQGAGKPKKDDAAQDKATVPLEYKGDKSIEEILDFIEGNKNRNLKRNAKKMRRKQRQLEEEERRRKEEEEAERLRQEELRRQEEEERRRLEEERRRQELLLKEQNRKKNKKKGAKPTTTNQSNAKLSQASTLAPAGKKSKSQVANERLKSATSQNQKTTREATSQKLAAQSTRLSNTSAAKKQPTKPETGKQLLQKQLPPGKPKVAVEKSKQPQQPAKKNTQKKEAVAQSVTTTAQKSGAEAKGPAQPQMVTIKRVMQPNSSEPTVTITLRGPTPKDDKVLYTLLNGQMCQVKDDKSKKQPPAPTNAKKGKPANNVAVKPSPPMHAAPPPQMAPKNVVNFNKSCSIVGNGVNSITERMERLKLGPLPVTHEPPKRPNPPTTSPAELTTPTAIQINQAVNQLSARPSFPNSFDLENIKLPPGITITKVDPATVQRKPIQVKQQPPPQPVPQTHIRQNMMPSVPSSSNVIVVDTIDKNNYYQSAEAAAAAGKKKRRKRRKNGADPMGPEGAYGAAPMSFGAHNGGLPPRVGPFGAAAGGMYGGHPFMSAAAAAGYGGMAAQAAPQQPAAIIQMNGSMVTIRNPAVHRAYGGGLGGPTMEYQDGGPMKKHFDDKMLSSPPEDMENGDVDDYERELEAFKRFCSQSVPAESKAKVNLNIEDIVLKKKGPVIGCS